MIIHNCTRYRIQKINVGDIVISPKGNPYKVTHVSSDGSKIKLQGWSSWYKSEPYTLA